MQVVRLEVFGFKSFMDRLVLPLGDGITGVVGPNGCGKSNVVDALRWVMGETRASQLRGGVLEDIIFNGTDKLRPLGLAEVTLTLRATGQDILSDLLLASEDNEILPEIPVKIESIEKPKLRVISGGAVDQKTEGSDNEDLLARPQEEPSSELNIETEKEPQDNRAVLLARYGWLGSVAEVQITRRLYRSGESEFFINRVPSRLKDIKELLRNLGMGARAYTIVAQGEVGRIVTAKPEDLRTILEDAAGILGFKDKIAEATRRLSETKINIQRLADIITELSRQVSSLKRQATRARTRQELKEEIVGLEELLLKESLIDFSERSKLLKKEEETLQSRLTEAEDILAKTHAEEQSSRGALIEVDIRVDEIRREVDIIKEKINSHARLVGEKRSKINELKALVLARDSEFRRLEERQKTLAERKESAKRDIQQLESEDLKVTEEINKYDTGLEEELRAANSKLQELRESIRNKERLVREIREKVVSCESSLRTVEEQVVAASPVTQLKRTLGAGLVDGILPQLRMFVDGIKVPQQYTKAVQSLLGERAGFIVSENPYEIAKKFVQELDQTSKKGLGVGVFRLQNASSQKIDSIDCPFKSLYGLLEINEEYKLAAQRVFNNVFVAETAAEAISFLESKKIEELPNDFTIITYAGDIFTAHSFYSLRHDGGLVQLKLRERTLGEELQIFNSQYLVASQERDIVQAELSKAEAHHAQILKQSQERQSLVRDLGRTQGSIRGRMQSEKRMMEQLNSDSEKINQQITDCLARINELKSQEKPLEDELKQLEAKSHGEEQSLLIELNQQISKIEEERKQSRNNLDLLAKSLDSSRNTLDLARKDYNNWQLSISQLELEQNALIEKSLAELGEERVSAIKENVNLHVRIPEEERKTLHSRALQIRQRLVREGEVDPAVIEEYEAENARLEPLVVQKGDLETAASTLEATIERLTKTSEKRFLSTFEIVRDHFVELVPRLFGGGKADLELTDPEHPIDSGVIVMVRPPGKKPKTIELLSGGEKALCATALIFAMFKVRPSPLCVLDEVDAPLDDANLARFLDFVQEQSKETQFLMITHNKLSMAVSNNLVGVTMQEPGSSKIISVTLQEAEQQVA